jgi:hypothetical protein
MIEDIRDYFRKHEIEFEGRRIIADGHSFEYQWCPVTAVRISRSKQIPLYDANRIAFFMIIDRIEHIFGTIRY